MRFPRKKKRSRLMRNPFIVDILLYAILVFAAGITVLPLLNVLARSFSPSHLINKYPLMFYPMEPIWDAYAHIFKTNALTRSFLVSVCITLAGTLSSLIFTLPAAYIVSKRDMPGNKAIMRFIVFTMMFGAGLIPFFILIRDLRLIDNYLVMILPGLISPFNMILVRNFMWSIPDEVEEAARIDGANDLYVLVRVVLPLCTPVIATVGLFYAIGLWNDFFTALFFITDNSKWPLQVLLRSIVIDNNMVGMGAAIEPLKERYVSPENIKAACIIFAIVPILLVYPFLQRYFIKGMILGAVKG